MKRNLSRLFVAAVVAAVLCPPLVVAQAEQHQGEHRLPLVKYVEPSYPVALRIRGITKGYATVLVTVDRTGRLIDAYATEFSHRRFADASVQAIKKWTFEEDATGSTVPRLFPIRINFLLDGLVMVYLQVDETLDRADRLEDVKPAYKAVSFDDLDKHPGEVNTPMPVYPEALKPERKSGNVEILFIVDDSGRVRVPSVTQSDDPLFAAAAIEAIQRWTFEPPTHHGKPASAFSLHRFTFSARPSSNG